MTQHRQSAKMMGCQGDASQCQEGERGMVGNETCEPEKETMGKGAATAPTYQALRFCQQEVSDISHP